MGGCFVVCWCSLLHPLSLAAVSPPPPSQANCSTYYCCSHCVIVFLARVLLNCFWPYLLQAYLNKLAGQAAQLKWRVDEHDSGSPRIQVAILTEKIVYLTKHMQQHPHDYHSRRGLITMVNKRRR